MPGPQRLSRDFLAPPLAPAVMQRVIVMLGNLRSTVVPCVPAWLWVPLERGTCGARLRCASPSPALGEHRAAALHTCGLGTTLVR
jgi:hypothetical protein